MKSVFIFVDYINILEDGNNNFVGLLKAGRNDAIIGSQTNLNVEGDLDEILVKDITELQSVNFFKDITTPSKDAKTITKNKANKDEHTDLSKINVPEQGNYYEENNDAVDTDNTEGKDYVPKEDEKSSDNQGNETNDNHKENIGKQLTGCEKLAVVKFEPIPFEEIPVTKTDLRKDQLYPLKIVQAEQTGECSGDLTAKDLGSLLSLPLVNLRKSYFEIIRFPNCKPKSASYAPA
ncbi:hypothetical protein ILUMI_24543 [Ignelater luminosus]|uniref:Uncharacterized protein n=1 Tax=Ignelater luminosus TaxID=2038154 RepID=A0A8K0CA06_IGNLU|nr:hypothetical protein ILUMI_24543 [Ignelater luminosus]